MSLASALNRKDILKHAKSALWVSSRMTLIHLIAYDNSKDAGINGNRKKCRIGKMSN